MTATKIKERERDIPHTWHPTKPVFVLVWVTASKNKDRDSRHTWQPTKAVFVLVWVTASKNKDRDTQHIQQELKQKAQHSESVSASASAS